MRARGNGMASMVENNVRIYVRYFAVPRNDQNSSCVQLDSIL